MTLPAAGILGSATTTALPAAGVLGCAARTTALPAAGVPEQGGTR